VSHITCRASPSNVALPERLTHSSVAEVVGCVFRPYNPLARVEMAYYILGWLTSYALFCASRPYQPNHSPSLTPEQPRDGQKQRGTRGDSKSVSIKIVPLNWLIRFCRHLFFATVKATSTGL
jgi:hypothetical protein